MNKIRIDADRLPELDTQVAVAGSARRQEVGGPACVGVLVGIAIVAAL